MIIVCSHCYKTYKRPRSHAGKFCGQKCFGLSRLGIKPWNKGVQTGIKPWLGKRRSAETVEKIRKTLTGFKHSEETKQKLSKIKMGNKSTTGRLGELSNNWKGGVTQKGKIGRNTKEYQDWRKEIFARDKYTCQSCGKKGCELNAHHIENYSPYIKNNTEDGITLCRRCHYEFHKMFGYTNNTKQQFLTYVMAN